jgi:large subunit ribosomal protein L1
MPTPVPPTADIKDYIERFRKTVLVRLRGQPVLQCRVGTEEMPEEHVAENIQTVLGRIETKLKKGLKNIESIYVKTTMGQPVKMKL